VCHSIDGAPKLAPTWKGLFGKTETMTDGSSHKVDENYLRESIVDPAAKIVKGYAPTMPSYQGQLSDKDLDGLIEYMKTLK
jgi:cytochrome c oxidase subunit 2